MTLEQTIQQLPSQAGVYQYFDKNSHLLYVGKAKNLKNRVKSYWQFSPSLSPNKKLSLRISKMIQETRSMRYIVVNSEHDALILENSLIKQLNPKYNILLRDDKTYPYIYIDYSQKYPRPDITRKIINSSNIVYFGPYSVGAREIVDSLYEFSQLVQKKSCLNSHKLCLYHQMQKCLGPCELPITQGRYYEELNRALAFIKNKKILIKELEKKMLFYAEELRFEEAKELRDRIEKIGRSEIKSNIDFASQDNYDVFVVQVASKRAVVMRMFMRSGKIISSTHSYVNINENFDEDELYYRVLLEYYKEEKPPIIAPILLGKEIIQHTSIEDHLTTLFEKKADIKVPLIGKRRELVALAFLNAKELLKTESSKEYLETLQNIQILCFLEKTPSRIEIFDNSHMSGMASVGAMVVYDEGKFHKKSYRTYHLKAKDEYAQMREVLTRRVESFEKNPPPDLWVIDGGATLLQLAKNILSSHGIYLDIIAISKEKIDAKSHRAKGKANDILHIPTETFKLQNSDKRLQFIQNLRDEAHRSAITFHQKTKLKQDKESKLLQIKGISQAKIIKLLKHFGTFEALKKANIVDISDILNKKDALIIKKFYT